MINEPKLEWLPLSSLQVDPYVQREYRPNKAARIAKTWDDEKLGVFKVSRRGGGDHIVDGQHRRGALFILERNDQVIPALVYEGLTFEDEAKIFLADNSDNTTVHPIDIYRLSLVAKEPVAVAIQGVLEEHGLEVRPDQASNGVAAVQALRWLHERGGVDLLDKTLTLIEATWGQGNRSAREGSILKGLGKVLIDTTGARLDIVGLAEKLGRNGAPASLVGTANGYRGATGMSLWLQVAHVVVSIYNKGKISQRVDLA